MWSCEIKKTNRSLQRKRVKLLCLREDFAPLETKEDDEIFRNGIFQWNISRMIEWIRQREDGISIEKVDIKHYHAMNGSFAIINEDHVMSTDLSKPVIQAEINPGEYIVIDGHHRLLKAYRLGVEYVDAYLLKVDQHVPFLITTRGYAAFVEYWNRKANESR